MSSTTGLSDKGLSIFAFAVYHQLSSGDVVTGVAAVDHAGHKADPQGVEEVEKLGLAKLEGETITFTDEGQKRLQQYVAKFRDA